tara:strand:+ start:18942 stop:19220 length:279 start_codon:yes stop_codon:yes gene_type:complete
MFLSFIILITTFVSLSNILYMIPSQKKHYLNLLSINSWHLLTGYKYVESYAPALFFWTSRLSLSQLGMGSEYLHISGALDDKLCVQLNNSDP